MIVKQYVFTETNEVRPPKAGEWFLLNGEPQIANIDYSGSRSRYWPILTREVREVEIPDPVPAWIEEAADRVWADCRECHWRDITETIASHYRAAKAEGRLDEL